MRILGIDPGTTQSAVLAWNGAAVVYAEMLQNDDVPKLIQKFGQDGGNVVACEHLQSFGMAVGKEVYETAYQIGVFWRTAQLAGLPFARIYRSEEKMALCGSVRAKDANIRQAILERFGGKEAAIGKKAQPGPLYSLRGDLWSAMAVVLTFLDKRGQIA